MNLSKSWLSRLLDVARLPDALTAAFSDIHDITVRVARDIKPLAGDPRALIKMHEEAHRIIAAHTSTVATSTGPEVAKRLVKATLEPVAKSTGEKQVTAANGEVILCYTRVRGGGLTIKVPPKSAAMRADILTAIEGLLP